MQETTRVEAIEPMDGVGSELARGATRERRRYERWDPGELSTAFVTSSTSIWWGRMLNLSDGGTEILGLPPMEEWIGEKLNVEVLIDDCSVQRTGILASIRDLPLRHTHTIVFVESQIIEEIDYGCTACGAALDMLPDDEVGLEAFCLCAACLELTAQRLGYESRFRGSR